MSSEDMIRNYGVVGNRISRWVSCFIDDSVALYSVMSGGVYTRLGFSSDFICRQRIFEC